MLASMPGSARMASVDPGKALLTFATVAAFALPMPYGVLISGALSVVQMFFGGGGNDLAQAFQQAMQALLDNIVQYLTIQQIQNSANTIQTALEWMNTNAQVIKDLATNAGAHDYIVTTALPYVSSIDAPNSDLRNALTTLLNVQLPGNNADWDLRMKAFDVLAMGVATYVTYLRVRTQMQAALEAEPNYTGPRELYAFYDTFRLETLHWATTLSQRINDLATERSNLVGPLQRGEDHQFCMDQSSCSYAAATDGYWTFTDNEPGRGRQGKWQDTAQRKTSCGQIYYDSVQHRADADKARQAYIARLDSYMDGHFAGAKSMIQGFQDAIKTWNESLTPRVPASAPGTERDLGKWGGNVPQGTRWVKGAKVRYAVTFANDAGMGPQGPWGPWSSITEKAWPLVVDIPTDPLDLTTVRQLHRQFATPDGKDGADEVVDIIQDNQTTTYQDINN